MRRFGLLAVIATSLAASGGAAHAQMLGSAYAHVHQAYASARAVQVGGARALELHDVDYAGFHWRTVDFVFNGAGGLDHLTMTSDVASYDDVLQAASMRMQEESGITSAVAPGGPELQIRVCEQRGGGVTVTYEAAPTLS